MSDKRYLVVTQQIVGSPESWSMDYSSDLETFTDRQAAIDHGEEVLGHDDFNVATVDGDGRLVAFGFDHEDWPNDLDHYDEAEISRQLGLPQSLAQQKPEACPEPPWDAVFAFGCGKHDDGMHRCSAAAGGHRVHQCLCGVQRYVPEGAKA
jgi:hypothetical protein